MTEYLHALKDVRNKIRPKDIPRSGSVVLTTDSLDGLKPKWNLARVIEKIVGRDDVVRGFRLRSNKGFTIERPL